MCNYIELVFCDSIPQVLFSCNEALVRETLSFKQGFMSETSYNRSSPGLRTHFCINHSRTGFVRFEVSKGTLSQVKLMSYYSEHTTI